MPILTHEGEARLKDLRDLLVIGRGWIASPRSVQPAEALAYLESAGSAALLLRGLPEVYRTLVSRFGNPSGWTRLLQTGSAIGATAGASGRPPITIEALTRAYGPGPADDLDVALYTITTEVQAEWNASQRQATGAPGVGE